MCRSKLLFSPPLRIWVGAALSPDFAITIYIPDTYLLLTDIKMILKGEASLDPEKNQLVKLFRRLMPVTKEYGCENAARPHGL